MSDTLYWGYGFECDGDPVEVVIVDLGPEVNAALRRLYEQPTNLIELNVLITEELNLD